MQLGDNALHLAAEGGQLDTMKYLCSHSRLGERWHNKDQRKQTWLDLAQQKGQHKVVCHLKQEWAPPQ